MSRASYPKSKWGSTLWKIGLWATVWWAVSCLYILLLVWQSRTSVETFGWNGAIRYTFNDSTLLRLLLSSIVIGWAIGAIIWLRELQRQNISYRTAFKDLFLTIRK